MTMTTSTLEFLLGKPLRHLREGDESEEEEETEEEEDGGSGEDPYDEAMPERADETDKPTSELPLDEDTPDSPEGDQEKEVLADGQIPQDASGITEGDFDPLNPHGEVDVKFEEGNWDSIQDMGQVVADKTTMITKTLEPLVEKALIELLGASTMYKRVSANITGGADPQDGQFKFNGVLIYQCSFWIGVDVEKADIEHDAQYILNTLKPISDTVNISSCAIDTADGSLKLGFSL
jgi:hypothetical protein